MCLLDTTDGALMMTLYTSTSLAHDTIAILYYSIVLTCITIFAALSIGLLQLLVLISNTAEPSGRFWDGVAAAGDHYDVIGGAICGTFLVGGGVSVLVYRPWRRWIDAKRRRAGEIGIEDGVQRDGESYCDDTIEPGTERDASLHNRTDELVELAEDPPSKIPVAGQNKTASAKVTIEAASAGQS